jgi:RNA polymerase sigma-70 factor, ECF subfamily
MGTPVHEDGTSVEGAAAAGQPSDEGVMRAVQAGNVDQLGVLFRRHSRRVFVQCLRMVGDPDAADDLVQETFLRVFRYRDSFRGTARLSTWLHRIATNVCIDHLRARERPVTASPEPDAQDTTDTAFQFTESEGVAVLRDALDKLPRDKRELLTMCRLEGLSYGDMAKRLGVTEATLRVRVHRAMKDLKTTFDSLWAGERGGAP